MVDFIQRAISRAEERCNGQLCPECGVQHHVSFRLHGLYITCSYDGGPCEEFRKKCHTIMEEERSLAFKEDCEFILKL